MVMERREASAEAEAESEMTTTAQLHTPRKKKSKINNKRRFSDEQIKLLESIFESETKLEPRKKLQLAGDLGLQPRQVAIWFQNRRARWKSKQIEHEYKILRANYESLASRYESLKKEKESLLSELQTVNELLRRPVEDGSRCKAEAEAEEKLCFSQEEEGSKRHRICFGSSEEGRLNVNEPIADGSGVPSEKFDGGFESCGLMDPSCSSSHWLNFWI